MTAYRQILDNILSSALSLPQPGSVLDEQGACAITLEDDSIVLLELSDRMDLFCLSTVLLPLPEDSALLLRRVLEFNVESGILSGTFVAATRDPATLICLSRCPLHPEFSAVEFGQLMTAFVSAASIARQLLAAPAIAPTPIRA